MNEPSPLPRYAVIRHALESMIMSGTWPPGHRIPSEQELLAEYGCSRMTVSKALTALAAAGLVVRKRRAGSFVAARSSEETVLDIHDIKADVLASGKPYRYELISRRLRAATPRDVARLGVRPGTDVLAILARHFSGDHALVLEDRLVSLAAVPEARDEAFSESPPGTWLLARIPWSEAEHVISAVPATAAIARRLGVHPHSACLVMERRTWQVGAPVTAVRLVYPGDRHRFVGRFSPASAPSQASARR